jgi:hypothetical protein
MIPDEKQKLLQDKYSKGILETEITFKNPFQIFTYRSWFFDILLNIPTKSLNPKNSISVESHIP